MADVSGKFFSAKKVRTGVSPSSPGVEQGETLPPVNPPGSDLNSVGLSMPSAFNVANTPLTSNGTIAVTGAGTVAQYVRGDGSLASFPSLTGYVPYTGATQNVDLGEFGLDTGFVNLDTTPTNTPTTQGTMYWDDSRSTAALIMNGTLQHIGQDTFFYVKNSTGSSIAKGTAVRFDGTDGASGHLLIAPFLANGTYPSNYFMGVTAETIGNGGFGQVMHFGELSGINTSGYTAGALLYASTTVAGGFQTTAPVAPNNIVLIAAAINSKNNGEILVRPTYGSNINQDEGVKIVSPTTGQLLQLQSNGLWENKTKAQVLGGISSQFVKGDGSLDSTTYQSTAEKGQPNGYASLDGNGKVPLAQINDALIGNVNYQGLWNAATNNPTLANPPSSGTKGYYYIVSTAGTFAGISFEVGDWIISNGSAWQKVDNTDAVSSVFGRTGNVIAANGDYNTSQVTENTNLYFTQARVSANTDVAANTAARHNAVTLGVANGLGLSGQQLSLQLATGSQNGALSSSDWTTFNSKENAITAGTTAQYFRGDKTFQTLNTGVVPESGNLYFTNARAIASTLTGYTSGAGTISAADSILSAIQKLNGNIGALVTGVSSVFGRTGAVIAANGDYYLGTTAIQAASANQGLTGITGITFVAHVNDSASITTTISGTSTFFDFNLSDDNLNDEWRWRFTPSGASVYNAMRLVPTTNTTSDLIVSGAISGSNLSGTNTGNVTLGTANGLDLTGQQLSLGLASAGVTGALSGTDWSTFNSKQQALNGTGFVKISGTTISYDNSTYLTGNQTITLSGDATGSGATAITVVLANSGVTAGTYNDSATQVRPFTVDAKGRITSIGTAVTITPDWANISGQRTLTRDDAGLQGNAGARSGFFETVSPVNYYSGANSWQHLIESRHTNDSNNYAMQIAGSFFDQEFYVRKTNNSATTAWSRVWHSGNITPVTGTGTSGQVAFFNGTSSITGESNLFWDSTNDRLGVGTASPGYRLDLLASSAADSDIFRAGMSGVSNGFTIQRVSNNLRYTFLDGNITIENFDSPRVFVTGNGATGFPGFNLSNTTQGYEIIVRGNISNTFQIRNTTASTDLVTITPSGNLGLGVTPSAWGASIRAIQIGNGASIFNWTGGNLGNVNIGSNNYDDGAGAQRYINSSVAAALYGQSNGQHIWLTAPSGTAGAAITFTQAMTLGSNSGLSIGTPSAAPSQGLLVQGAATFTNNVTIRPTSGYNAFFQTSGTALRINYLNDALSANISATYRATDFGWQDSGGNSILTLASTGAATFSSSVTVEGVYIGRRNSIYQNSSSTNILNVGRDDDMYGGSNLDGGVFVYGNNKFHISTNSNRRLTVDGGGNVGIGTLSPTNRLDVTTPNKSTILASDSAINVDYTTSTVGQFQTIGFSYSSSIGNRNQYWGMGFTPTSYAAGLGDLFFFTGASERVRITSGGNVGIGTNSPNRKLVVQGTFTSNEQLLYLKQGDDNGFSFNLDAAVTGNLMIRGVNSGTETASLLTIRRDNGNVGIGTASPSRTFQVNGYISSFDGTTNTEIISSGGVGYFGTSTNHPLVLQTNNTERMRITSGGNVGIGTAITNTLLNINVPSSSTNGLSLIDSSTVPVVFTYSSVTGENRIGGLLSYVFPTFYSGGSERMRIWNSSGNVNIGPTPSSDAGFKLDVNGTGRFSDRLTINANSGANALAINGRSSDNTGSIDFFQNNGTTRVMEIGISPTAAEFYYDANSPMIFYTNGSPRLTIANSGAATFSSSVTIQNGNSLTLLQSGNANGSLIRSVTNGDFRITTGGTTDAFTITNGGNVGIGCIAITKFQVQSNTNRRFFVSDTGSQVQIGGLNDAGSDYVPTAIDGTRLLLNAFSGGNVLIGTTTSVNHPLVVRSNTDANSICLVGRSSDNASSLDFFGSNSSTFLMEMRVDTLSADLNYQLDAPMIFYTNTVPRMRITNNGNLLINTTDNTGGERLRVAGTTFTDAIVTMRPSSTTVKSDVWKLGRAALATSSVPEDIWVRVQIGTKNYDLLAIDRGTA
jgi:hypothetical protein